MFKFLLLMLISLSALQAASTADASATHAPTTRLTLAKLPAEAAAMHQKNTDIRADLDDFKQQYPTHISSTGATAVTAATPLLAAVSTRPQLKDYSTIEQSFTACAAWLKRLDFLSKAVLVTGSPPTHERAVFSEAFDQQELEFRTGMMAYQGGAAIIGFSRAKWGR